MAVMVAKRYWEDTFAFRISLVSDHCKVGYCIVTLLYCNALRMKNCTKRAKCAIFSFSSIFVHEMPSESENVIVNVIVRLL